MKDLDCTPKENNDSQEYTPVTEGVTQDVSEDSTKADEGGQLKEGGRTYAQLYSKFEIKDGETKGKEDWGADMPNLNERFSKYVRDVVTPFAMKDWRWILNFVRMWGSWTLVVNLWYVVLAMAILGSVVLHTRIVKGTTADDNGQYKSSDTARAVRTNVNYVGCSDDGRINSYYTMSLREAKKTTTLCDAVGERGRKRGQSTPLGSAQTMKSHYMINLSSFIYVHSMAIQHLGTGYSMIILVTVI